MKLRQSNDYELKNKEINIKPIINFSLTPGLFYIKLKLKNGTKDTLELDSNSILFYSKAMDPLLINTKIVNDHTYDKITVKPETMSIIKFGGVYKNLLFQKNPHLLTSTFLLFVYLEKDGKKNKYGPWKFEFKNKERKAEKLRKLTNRDDKTD
jgi:hypothetical protein